jgi:hypothetical protein
MSQVLFAFLFLAVFVVMWCAVCVLIGQMGGWQALAERYGAAGRETGETRWAMQSGQMRMGTRYNGVLNIGADVRGLSLAVIFLFRPGHPPLFIPWEAIEIREKPGFFWASVELVFREVPGVQLTVSKNLGMKIAQAGHRPIAGAQV